MLFYEKCIIIIAVRKTGSSYGDKQRRKYAYTRKTSTLPFSFALTGRRAKTDGFFEKERRFMRCGVRGSYHLLHRPARPRVFRLFRFKNSHLPFLCVGGGVRPEKYPFLFRVSGKNRAGVQNGAFVYSGVDIRHLYRLDVDCQRYGSAHVFALGLSRPHLDGQTKIYGVHVHYAKYRREPRRYANAFWKPAKFVSVSSVFHPHGRFHRDHATPILHFRCSYHPLLSCFHKARAVGNAR